MARPAPSARSRRDEQARLLARRLPLWERSPALFAEDVLGLVPWGLPAGIRSASQREVIDAIATHRSVAWRSGHKVGKSEAAAAVALWWYALRPGGRVILTAPTARQIREVIWRAVRRQWRNAAARGLHLGGGIGETPSTGIVGPDGRQVIGISTDEPDRFSGISGDVLYIVDEGSGVPDPIWEAIEGNRAGGARLLTLGNPTRTSGAFFRAFHEEAELWATFHTSSEHTPAALGLPLLPGQEYLAGAQWIEDRRRAWAPHTTHPLYAVRVAGEFPTQGTDAVFSLLAITDAIARWREGEDPSPMEMRPERLVVGVDPARFGDDQSAIVARRGRRVLRLVSVGGKDTVQVAGLVRALVNELSTPWERSGHSPEPIVNVDTIGVGAGVADQLRATVPGIIVQDINVALPADEDELYPNLRSQLWFGAAEWIRNGQLPDDPRLRADLLAPKYRFDVRGRQAVESKDDMRKRLGRSPDLGDAFCLATYARAPLGREVGLHVPGL